MNIKNINRILAELRKERKKLDHAIAVLEKLTAKPTKQAVSSDHVRSGNTKRRVSAKTLQKPKTAKIILFRRVRSIRPRPSQAEEA